MTNARLLATTARICAVALWCQVAWLVGVAILLSVAVPTDPEAEPPAAATVAAARVVAVLLAVTLVTVGVELWSGALSGWRRQAIRGVAGLELVGGAMVAMRGAAALDVAPSASFGLLVGVAVMALAGGMLWVSEHRLIASLRAVR